MPEPNILVTRHIPDVGLQLLRERGATVSVLQDNAELPVPPEALLTAIADADVLLALLTERIGSDLLERAPRLRGIANYAVGYDNIDVAAATALGIPVSNTPGVLTEATADLTFALLLAVARRIPEADAYMRSGRYALWGPELLLGADVGRGADDQQRTLGIIGFGRIGQAVARRALGFDMHVLACDPDSADVIERTRGVRWSDLDSLLERSDFVTLHTPLTPGTQHIIGEREFTLMKPTAYLINTARGPLIDETALVRALQERRIAGAALDVYEREPAMAEGLTQCDNAILLPHIGSATVGTRERMATMAATNALAHLDFEPAPDAVDRAVYGSDAYAQRVQRLRGR